MLTIELSPNPEDPGTLSDTRYLVVNGKLVEDSWASKYTDEVVGGIYDEEVVIEVMRSPLREIFSGLNELHLPFHAAWCEDLAALTLSDGKRKDTEAYVKFEFRFESEEWARPWSILAFADRLQSVVQERSVPGLTTYRDDDEFVTNGFGLNCRIEQVGETTEREIERWTPELVALITETVQRLTMDTAGHSISQAFRFPPEIAVACEQYLIYFGQFLADLGIDASVDLSHVAGQSLFRVTPRSSKQALEAIRSALDDYLDLASDRAFEVTSHASGDIAVLQLRANVSHLQGQLSLAQAVLEAKNATIDALRLSSFQLQELAAHARIGGDANRKAEAPPDAEIVIEGVLSVKRTEVKGVVVHWPEIIRKLKRRFRRKD